MADQILVAIRHFPFLVKQLFYLPNKLTVVRQS